jgi:hypothetical protein
MAKKKLEAPVFKVEKNTQGNRKTHPFTIKQYTNNGRRITSGFGGTGVSRSAGGLGNYSATFRNFEEIKAAYDRIQGYEVMRPEAPDFRKKYHFATKETHYKNWLKQAKKDYDKIIKNAALCKKCVDTGKKFCTRTNECIAKNDKFKKRDGICNYYKRDKYIFIENSDYCIKPNYNGKIASCDYTCKTKSNAGWCKKTAKCVRKNESCVKCLNNRKKKYCKDTNTCINKSDNCSKYAEWAYQCPNDCDENDIIPDESKNCPTYEKYCSDKKHYGNCDSYIKFKITKCVNGKNSFARVDKKTGECNYECNYNYKLDKSGKECIPSKKRKHKRKK